MAPTNNNKRCPVVEKPQGFQAGQRQKRGEFECLRGCGEIFETLELSKRHGLECPFFLKTRREQKEILNGLRSSSSSKEQVEIIYEDDASLYDLSKDVVRETFKPIYIDSQPLIRKFLEDCSRIARHLEKRYDFEFDFGIPLGGLTKSEDVTRVTFECFVKIAGDGAWSYTISPSIDTTILSNLI